MRRRKKRDDSTEQENKWTEGKAGRVNKADTADRKTAALLEEGLLL